MTYFDENDLKETQINHRVELEYYRTNKCEEDNFKYGDCVVPIFKIYLKLNCLTLPERLFKCNSY